MHLFESLNSKRWTPGVFESIYRLTNSALVSKNTQKFLSELCYSLHSAALRFIPFDAKANILLIFKTTQAFESEPGKSHYACATLCCEASSDSSEQRERLWGGVGGAFRTSWNSFNEALVEWAGACLTTGEQIDKTCSFYISILVFGHDCLFVEAIQIILFYHLILWFINIIIICINIIDFPPSQLYCAYWYSVLMHFPFH